MPNLGRQCLEALEDLSEIFIFVDDPSLYILYKVVKPILTYALISADASLKNATIPRVVVRDELVDRFQLHRSGEISLPSPRKMGDLNTPQPHTPTRSRVSAPGHSQQIVAKWANSRATFREEWSTSNSHYWSVSPR